MNDQEFDLRRTLGVLRRQWRLAAVTFVVVLGLAALGIFALKPAYTAQTLVLVDPSSKNLLNPETQVTSSAADSARVESEVQIVVTETTLLKVIDDLDLLQDPEFGVQVSLRDRVMELLRLAQPKAATAEETLAAAVTRLRQSIRVLRNGLTYLITISATADDAESAANISNTMASAYIRAQVESKISTTMAAREILEGRVADASSTVVQSEESLNDYITSSVDQIIKETGRTDLAQLRDELMTATDTRTQLTDVADLAQRSIAASDWVTVANTLQSETLSRLQVREAELRDRLVTVVQGTQAETDLRAELAAVAADLNTNATAEVSRLRTEIADAQARAADLQVQIRAVMLSANLPPSILTSIYELQQTAELARGTYQNMLTRLKELEAQAFLQVADSRVVSPAPIPDQPSFPDTRLLLAVAGMVALGLGIALAFLRENVVGGFTNDIQLSSVLKTPVVTAVPRQRGNVEKGGERTSHADLVVSMPFSQYAEAMRRLQVGIDQALRRNRSGYRHREEGAIVMVTSANANEGKSTLALSLARTYALSGRNTLLIDCDLRKPSVHKQLGLAPSSRLLEYLADPRGEIDLDYIMVSDPKSTAKVAIGSRRADMAGGQIITGEFFGRLLAEARERFEIVVLDTPPVGAVVDGLYLAQFADSVVLVTRYGTTSQQDARAANSALSDAKRDNVELLSVLNAQEQSRRTARRKYAEYYVN